MNAKSFFRLALTMIVGLAMAACSSSTDELDNAATGQMPTVGDDGLYHYTMQLDCPVPYYDDEMPTRAMTYDWDDNRMLIIRFKNGSSWINGQATYKKSENIWNVATVGTLPVVSGEETCEVYYFYEATNTSSSAITMNERTACYFTKTGKYKHPSAEAISLTASLQKMTWRMRFKGTAGTTITLPASENDIKFYSTFNRSTGAFSSAQKDVTLTVASNGYTPYIYGSFANTSDNKITVRSDADYYRTLTAASLAVGESGSLTIPTSSNYANMGWKANGNFDPNATINIDPESTCTFTDGIVMEWVLGSNVNTFDFTVATKNYAESLSDDELANVIGEDLLYTMEQADYQFKNTDTDFFKPNTQYYLCAVARNSKGVRGPVLRHLFTTNAENLPYAEISNVKANTTTQWTWDVALKNNAKAYYIATSFNESNIGKDWHWYAANTHYWIVTKQIDQTYDWESVSLSVSSGTCNVITICTWGVDASGNLGNPNVAYGSATSSARSLLPLTGSGLKKECISRPEKEMMRQNLKVYRKDN